MNVLVTGGAGYIGSHTAKALAREGHAPVVFDNLSTGNLWAVKWGPFVQADLSDSSAIKSALQEFEIESVVHFAANAYVGESMRDPRKYFRNNVVNTLNLLDAMCDVGVEHLVFSSSCATYGVPEALPLTETHPQRPISPYGESKLMVERVLHWYANAYGLRYGVLRYFNAAGADPDGEIGESHAPETHLVPLAVNAALGVGGPLKVFGTDYATRDGTAIRDFVHVSDLATAHVQAVDALRHGAPSRALNLGTGRGHSVLEVMAAVERSAGRPVPHDLADRREGDPAELVADPSQAFTALGWRPIHTELDDIVETACTWHTKRAGAG